MVNVEEYKRDSLHPPRETLIAFVEKRLEQTEIEQTRQHLEVCEFCREFCDDYNLLHESLRAAEQEELPPEAQALADRLYHSALMGQVIPLQILRPGADEHVLPLAADGDRQAGSSSDQALTLYSEDPEIVLRIMSGPQPDDNYVQLISDDMSLVSHVLIQAPQLDREFVTNDQGRAELGNERLEITDEVKWQVKMPDAVFDLEPLTYDPEKTEFSRQITLETDRQDRVEITFERKTEGKQITLRVLELDGSEDFGDIKVVVSTPQASRHAQIGDDKTATFAIDDADSTVNIRLFTK